MKQTIRTALLALACLTATGCQIGAPCGCGAHGVPAGYTPGPADRCLDHLRREWLAPCGIAPCGMAPCGTSCGAGACCGDACSVGCHEPPCEADICPEVGPHDCAVTECGVAGCPLPKLLGACKIPHKEPQVPLPPGPPGRFFPAPTRPVFAPQY